MLFWPDNSLYFVTSKIFLGEKLLDSHDKKMIVLNQIRKAISKLNVPIFGYSIAQNHHHSLLYFNDFRKHAKFKQIVNGGSAFTFNEKYRVKNESAKMWVDSKSLIVSNEKSLFKVIGYIAGNLLKHGEADNFKELKENPFSSFRQLVEKHGDEMAEDIVKAVIKIEEDETDFLINLNNIF